MIAAVSVSIADPGPGGFVLGGLLIVGGWAALRWLRGSAHRARAAVPADTRPVYTPGVVRVPEAHAAGSDVQGRREPATAINQRSDGGPDATAVLPRMREVRRG